LRGEYAPIQFLKIVVTAPRREGYRRNSQIEIAQKFVQLAQAGLR
jgi:hypothetical protein